RNGEDDACGETPCLSVYEGGVARIWYRYGFRRNAPPNYRLSAETYGAHTSLGGPAFQSQTSKSRRPCSIGFRDLLAAGVAFSTLVFSWFVPYNRSCSSNRPRKAFEYCSVRFASPSIAPRAIDTVIIEVLIDCAVATILAVAARDEMIAALPT